MKKLIRATLIVCFLLGADSLASANSATSHELAKFQKSRKEINTRRPKIKKMKAKKYIPKNPKVKKCKKRCAPPKRGF